MQRPDFIKNLKDVPIAGGTYPGDDEPMSDGHAIGKAVGLEHFGVHVELLVPGRRTSWPHAEEKEEEFILVLGGHPSVWIDGELFPLEPGDAVGFRAGTGIAHTFINDSDTVATLVVVGERKADNRIRYPFHPDGSAATTKERIWRDAPIRPLGPHDGRPRPRGEVG